MDPWLRADERLATVPELVTAAAREYAAQNIIPLSPIVDIFFVGLSDLRRSLNNQLSQGCQSPRDGPVVMEARSPLLPKSVRLAAGWTIPVTEDSLNMGLGTREGDAEEGDESKGEVDGEEQVRQKEGEGQEDQAWNAHRRTKSQTDDLDDPDGPDDPDDPDPDDPDPDDPDPDGSEDPAESDKDGSTFSTNLWTPKDAAKNKCKRASPQYDTIQSKKRVKYGPRLTCQYNTPGDLARAFGREDVKTRISALTQDWDKLFRSQILREELMPYLATRCSPACGVHYVDLLSWHGQQLARNTLEGQLYSLQSRLEYASYYSLYKVAVEDVRNHKNPPFFQWTDEWLEKRGKVPQKRRVGRGYRAECAVLDRLVEIHAIESTSITNKSTAQWKRTIEDWRKKGETPFEIMDRFGTEMMLLLPSDAADNQFKFTKPQMENFLTALALRRRELEVENILPLAKAFMTTCFFGSRSGQAAGTNVLSELSDHEELSLQAKPGLSVCRCIAMTPVRQTVQPTKSSEPLQIETVDDRPGSENPSATGDGVSVMLSIEGTLLASSDFDPSLVPMPSNFDDAWCSPSPLRAESHS